MYAGREYPGVPLFFPTVMPSSDIPALPLALLDACRTMIMDRLSQVIADALVRIGDELTAEAMRSDDAQRRELLLDAVMLVRAHGAEIETRFRGSFGQVFEQRMHPDARVEGAGAQTQAAELSLLSEDSLSDTLEVGRLAQHVSGALDADQVLGIRARLAALIERDWFDERRHPASPDAVFESLRQALSEFAPRSEVKTALLDAFSPYIAGSLNGVYEAVNDRLRANQVLPSLRPQVQVGTDSARRVVSPAPDPANSDGPSGSSAASTSSGASGGAATSMASGLSSSRAGGPNDARAGHTGGAGWTESVVQQFQQAMSAAQSGRPAGRRQVTHWLSDASLFESDEGPLSPVGPPLVAALTDLQRGPGDTQTAITAPEIAQRVRAQGSPLDQITAEIVSIVFDYIYSDRRLPDSVKQQLLRLQVVAVKAALLDRGFFARRQHPLRRLIDRMSEVGADPDMQTAAGAPLVAGFAEVVDQVIGDFMTDLSVFEQAIARVDALADQESERRAQALAQAAREAAQREALALAQDEARAELELRLEGEVPTFVRAFLSRWWSEVLAHARCARDAQASAQAWSVGVRAAEYLIWSVLPKHCDEITRLAAVLPGMMRALNRGLDLIDMPSADRSAFFDELMRAHTRELESAKRRTGSIPSRASVQLRQDGTVTYVPGAAAATRTAGAGARAVSAESSTAALSQLARGQRLDLRDSAGARTFKLAWISPARTLFILSRHPDETLTFEARQIERMLREGELSPATGPVTVERAIRRVASEEAVDTLMRDDSLQPA